MNKFAAALLVSILSVHAALAQETPVLLAKRDFAITYKPIKDGADTVRLYWHAASKKLRMDMPGVGWSVTDHVAGSGFLVAEEAKRIMDMPDNVRRNQLGPSPDAKFTRLGAERIAGHDCTSWSYIDQRAKGTICLTADGVMLRSQATLAGLEGGMEAVSVSYDPQPTSLFEAPAGYQRMQPRPQRNR